MEIAKANKAEITRDYIDELVKKAGLEETVSIFDSAIEICTHYIPYPEEGGYYILAKLIETALKDQK